MCGTSCSLLAGLWRTTERVLLEVGIELTSVSRGRLRDPGVDKRVRHHERWIVHKLRHESHRFRRGGPIPAKLG